MDPNASRQPAGAKAVLSNAEPTGAPGQTQLVHACIVAALAVVVWFAGVRRLEQQLSAKQAELKSVKGQLADFEHGVASGAPLEQAIESLSAQAHQVNAWAGASGDASRLYDAFRALAARSAVRIERVEPSSTGGGRAVGPRPKNGVPAEVFGYTIEITGTYAAAAKFMDACEQDLGVTKIASFHVSPNTSPASGGGVNVGGGAAAPADPLVTAIIETSHLKLAIPGVAGAAEKSPKPASTNAAAESGS